MELSAEYSVYLLRKQKKSTQYFHKNVIPSMDGKVTADTNRFLGRSHHERTQLFHRTRESAEYTVPTHIGVWVEKNY